MTTSNFNVRLDDNLRTEATQILASYGLSPAQAVKLFFNQVVATGKIPLSFDYQANELTLGAKTLQAIEQGRADYQAGKLDRFSPDDALEAIVELSRG